jgi:hypothetical protein
VAARVKRKFNKGIGVELIFRTNPDHYDGILAAAARIEMLRLDDFFVRRKNRGGMQLPNAIFGLEISADDSPMTIFWP